MGEVGCKARHTIACENCNIVMEAHTDCLSGEKAK